MTDTITDLIAARFAENTTLGNGRAASSVHAQQLRHRSRRRFKVDPISAETMDILFACALSAPAKSDLQQVSIIQLSDAEKREAVTDLIPSMPWIKQAPEFLIFCGDGRRIQRICELRGTVFAHDPLDAFLNAAADAAIVMQNFIIATEAEGLGCCPISAVREVTSEIADLCALPSGVFPFAGLCVGHPDDDPAISVRIPTRLTVHKNQYDDSHLEEELASYDQRRREVNRYRTQRNIDKYGEVEQYGWSDDKARQTSNTDRMSFTQHIKINGYDI